MDTIILNGIVTILKDMRTFQEETNRLLGELITSVYNMNNNLGGKLDTTNTRLNTINTTLTNNFTTVLTKLDTIITNQQEIHITADTINLNTDTVEAKLDTINETLLSLPTSLGTKLDTIHTDLTTIDGVVDTINTGVGTVNTNLTAMDTVLDTIYTELSGNTGNMNPTHINAINEGDTTFDQNVVLFNKTDNNLVITATAAEDTLATTIVLAPGWNPVVVKSITGATADTLLYGW